MESELRISSAWKQCRNCQNYRLFKVGKTTLSSTNQIKVSRVLLWIGHTLYKMERGGGGHFKLRLQFLYFILFKSILLDFSFMIKNNIYLVNNNPIKYYIIFLLMHGTFIQTLRPRRSCVKKDCILVCHAQYFLGFIAHQAKMHLRSLNLKNITLDIGFFWLWDLNMSPFKKFLQIYCYSSVKRPE